MFSKHDIEILRALARKVKTAAEKDNSQEKIEFWKRHTSLRGERPAVFVHPDDSYRELIPADCLECESEYARYLEMTMRKVIFHSVYLNDDVPILDTIPVEKVIHNTWWGIPFKREYTDATRGSFKHVPIIKTPDDWGKLSKPKVSYDAEATKIRYEAVGNAIGDILKPELCGIKDFDAHIMHWYCDYRGLDNMFMDLVLDPDTVHKVIRFFTDGVIDMYRQIEKLGLVSLNNDNTYHYTGGVGYNDELPGESFDPDNITLKNVWGAAEAQEFSSVSPQMHEEFILSYEREVLELFGLNGYGCCDNLAHKLDGVLKIKNLRRVAVCPWADISEFVPVLADKYIMTWKPQPAYLAYDKFGRAEIEHELADGIKKAKGGKLELILRDTTTVKCEPERFTEWISIARKAIEENWE